MITVTKACPQNHPCPMVKMCPQKAISQEGFGLPQVDSFKCTECGMCIRKCPYGAFNKTE